MALRIYMEKLIEKPDYSYFITLTYDEDHIPICKGRECFSKADITTFLDSLKHKLRRDGFTFRYFFTCEYGEEGYRPHYHALLFLYRLPNFAKRVSYPRLSPGKQAPHFYFAEQILYPLWKRGFVYQGTVSGASVLYCTSYALKDDEQLTRDWTGFEEGKPFRRYSLKPGLGLTDRCLSWWLEYIQNDGVNIRNTVTVHLSQRHISSGIPVGVKRRMARDYVDIYEQLKEVNLRAFNESFEDLKKNLLKYGTTSVYRGDKHYLSLYTDKPDKEMIAFTKAIRQMHKTQNKL